MEHHVYHPNPFPFAEKMVKKMAAIDRVKTTLVDKIPYPVGEISTATALLGIGFLFARVLNVNYYDHELINPTVLAPLALGMLSFLTLKKPLSRLVEKLSLYPSKKIGLEPNPLSKDDLEKDINFCIKQINLCSEELESTIEPVQVVKLVKDFIDQHYGFSRPVRRVKKSFLPLPDGTAMVYPFTNEIVVSSLDDKYYPYAHEAAHTQGVRNEAEAILTAIVSLISSGNKRLAFDGYLFWLFSLLSSREDWLALRLDLNSEESIEKAIAFLSKKGLNEISLDHLRKRWHKKQFKGAFWKIYHSLPNEIKNKISQRTGRAPSKLDPTTDVSIRLLHDYRIKFQQTLSF